MPKRNRSFADEDEVDIVPTTAEDRLTNIMLQKMLRRGLLLNTVASSTSQSPTSAANSSTVQYTLTTTFQTTQASPSTSQIFPEAMEMVTSVESIPVNSKVLHSSVAETVTVTNSLDPSLRFSVPSVNNLTSRINLVLATTLYKTAVKSPKPFSSQSGSRGTVCLAYNGRKGCTWQNCRYMHVCSKCGFNHAAINCFAKRTRQQSQPQSPQSGFSPSYIASNMSVLSFVQKSHGYSEVHSFVTNLILKGIRKLNVPFENRLPITLPILIRILKAIPLVVPVLFDRYLLCALFSVAFAGFFRLGELVVKSSFNAKFVLQVSDESKIAGPNIDLGGWYIYILLEKMVRLDFGF
ncbi:hypothetical protein LOTGIDRAFT_155042 [Lottia gigantea]|uniref:C3H1-type domain-containing protein n=1 Tax=Lottia gigantea TaxID=225164 RepID=V3ZX72_LOTGI|nr:hypothetical protein LOTGIDRAFT_155042 [Lottia gigantea]ESO85556.1 hypothetical protein LOTGIDRAFT_155042 [Lottia gigantea]